MKILTKDEFNGLKVIEQVEYINELCKDRGIDPYLRIENGNVIDIDSGETIEERDLFDYALDLNIEATDLQGKVFAD